MSPRVPPDFDEAAIARFHAALDEDDRRRARRRAKAESISVWVGMAAFTVIVIFLVVGAIVRWLA